MIPYFTVLRYLSYKFLGYFCLVSLVIISILFVSGAFDVLQKFSSAIVSPKDFWLLIFLKIPFLYNEVSALIGFISMLLFLRAIIASNELLIIISNGIAIWRVFVAPIVMSLLFGIIIIAIINPIATLSLRKLNQIEARIKHLPINNFVILGGDIFFYEKYQDDNRVIQAKSINRENKTINNITILFVNSNNQLLRRIDAPHAILENGYFVIHKPDILIGNKISNEEKIFLPTKLSVNDLIQNFSPPELVSIWSLPETISEMTGSGIPILNYEVYFFKQLFKPLTIAAMSMLACWFLNFNNRDNTKVKNMIFALILGIVSYFTLEIISRILAYGGITPSVATLLPILVIILTSNFVILHFQEA